MLLKNFLTITSPPIPFRVSLVRTIVCILNYRTSGPFSIITQRRIKKLVNTLCIDLQINSCSPRLKSRVGLGPRIPSQRVYDRDSFTTFHVQAVVPVILVKPIDTLPLAFVNILPPTNILTSLITS